MEADEALLYVYRFCMSGYIGGIGGFSEGLWQGTTVFGRRTLTLDLDND